MQTRPAAWLAQGTAVHNTLEAWSKHEIETGQLHEYLSEAYSKEITRLAAIMPLGEWFPSGRYKGPQDVERRFHLAHQQLDNLINHFGGQPPKAATLDGKAGVEYEFNLDLDGVHVRGFIDLVLDTPDGLEVIDYKTGNKPGDAFQLSVYEAALKLQHDVEAKSYYLMAKPTPAKVETGGERLSLGEVTKAFVELEEAITAGEFEAKPSKKNCMFCDVAHACPVREG